MDRRLLILMRLREETPVRASDLAEEIGCSVRTVYRDMDALSQSGVPVAAMPGEGYRLVEGYHLPPVAFTAEEAVQLLLGTDVVRRLGADGPSESARSAAAKVEAVLRPDTRTEVARLRERISVSPRRPQSSPWLALLQRAVVEDRALFLRYRSFEPGDITERKVEPHAMAYYGEDWHVVAYCRLREAMRDFRASRILYAELLDETFERLPGRDWWRDEGERETRQVRVWIDASEVPWARETVGFGFEREEVREGGSEFVFEVRDMRRLLPWILGWGAAARVVSPPDVVERMQDEAAMMARRYSE